MREARGDLWKLDIGAICITTNGAVRKDGCAVMGRGCAAQAKNRFPGIERDLGDLIQREGNHVHDLGYWDEPTEQNLFSFPVKHHWREKADPELIYRSACELVNLINTQSRVVDGTLYRSWHEVAVPRPGCGNGGLEWEDVKPLIEWVLDDRFVVVTY